MIKGRPDRWWTWARRSVVLREWRCAIWLAEVAFLRGGSDNGFLLSSSGEDDAFLGSCRL